MQSGAKLRRNYANKLGKMLLLSMSVLYTSRNFFLTLILGSPDTLLSSGTLSSLMGHHHPGINLYTSFLQQTFHKSLTIFQKNKDLQKCLAILICLS